MIAMPIGLTLPFARSTSSLGVLAYSSSELEATYYNLKSLVLTDWGERVNHLHLGCNLTEFLFQPNDDDTNELVKERLVSQVSQWLPYVSLDSVDITRPTDHRMSIKIGFSIRGRQDLNSVLDVTVSQAGG